MMSGSTGGTLFEIWKDVKTRLYPDLVHLSSILDWQPFFGQNYSEQEITLTTVLIQLISECLTLYIPLALDNLKNHEFLYYYTNKYTLLILTATPLMSQICSDI
jgi:hypothetical protein